MTMDSKPQVVMLDGREAPATASDDEMRRFDWLPKLAAPLKVQPGYE